MNRGLNGTIYTTKDPAARKKEKKYIYNKRHAQKEVHKFCCSLGFSEMSKKMKRKAKKYIILPVVYGPACEASPGLQKKECSELMHVPQMEIYRRQSRRIALELGPGSVGRLAVPNTVYLFGV